VKHVNKAIGLQDLVEGFLFSLQAEGRAPRTHEYYDKLLRHFLHYTKSQGWPERVDLLDAKRIRQFLFWVSSRSFEYVTGNGSRRFIKSKPSTAWPYYKALRRLFNWSVEEGFLEESPVKDIHFKAPPLPPVQPYDLEELKRFFAVCELDIRIGARFTGLRNKAMLLLFIDSGLRLSELTHLKLGDLNLEQRWVRVIGKGNKVGICPFSAKTAKAIWLYLLERKHRAKSDALWVTEEVAMGLRRLKVPIVRLAYDSNGIKESLGKAIKLLNKLGVNGRKIIVYCLYNHLDTPDDFLERIKDLVDWGVVSYPMRYQALEPGPKNGYVSPNWTKEQLEMIAKARRVIGCGGAFPPYEGLRRKIEKVRSFEEAFELRPARTQ